MKFLKIVQTILLLVLGALSVFLTLSILFNLFGIRQKQGNYVLFIVYTNLICGLLFLYAAYNLWKHIQRSVYALAFTTLLLILAFIALKIYIHQGGIYEVRTPKAMTFRTVFSAVMTAIALFIRRKETGVSV